MKRALAIGLLGFASATAHADAHTAKVLYADGQAQYKQQHYADAAASFAAAYDQDPDPVYLFNAAQAYRVGGDCVKAADAYRRFFAKVPNPPNAAKIHGWADEVTACARAKGVTEPPPVVDPPPPHDTPPPPPPPVVKPPPDPVKPPPPVVHAHGHARIYGATAALVGVAGLGLGVGYAIAASGAASDHDALCRPSCTWSADLTKQAAALDKRGDRDQTLSRVGFAVGGIGIAAAAVFLFVLHDEPAEHVAIAPSTSGASLLATWRF